MFNILSTLKRISRVKDIILTEKTVHRITRELKMSNAIDCDRFSLTVNQSFLSSFELEERQPPGLKKTDLNEIIEILGKGDAEVIKSLKKINFTHEYLKVKGARVPSILTIKNFKTLLKLDFDHWGEFFHHLYLSEIKSLRKYRKFLIERESIRKKLSDCKQCSSTETTPLPYTLGGNHLLPELSRDYVESVYNYNLVAPYLFSQKIVFDFIYTKFMDEELTIKSINQVVKALHKNRKHVNPFHAILCNINQNDYRSNQLRIAEPNIHEKHSLLADITNKSYLDLFPKEKLVYLSPYATNELIEYNDDDIYIIGACACWSKPLSRTFIQKHNLRSASLPIYQHLNWIKGLGPRILNIPVVMDILLNQRQHKNWSISLKAVPSEFADPFEKHNFQRKKQTSNTTSSKLYDYYI